MNVVVFNDTIDPMVEAVALIGIGETVVVELGGRMTLFEESLGEEGFTVKLNVAFVLAADGATVKTVLLCVGNGGTKAGEVAVGASSVVELIGIMIVVATAVPFTVIVETLAIVAPEDTNGKDEALVIGGAVRRVVEVIGLIILLAPTVLFRLDIEAVVVIDVFAEDMGVNV